MLPLDSSRCGKRAPASDEQMGNSSTAEAVGSKVKEGSSRPLKDNSIGDLFEDRDGWNPVSLPLPHSLGQAQPSLTSPWTVNHACPFHAATCDVTTLANLFPHLLSRVMTHSSWVKFCHLKVALGEDLQAGRVEQVKEL